MKAVLFCALLGAGSTFGQVSFTRTDIPAAAGIQTVKVADFNGDGIADIVNPVDVGIAILIGNGDGTFQAPKITTLSSASRIVAVADFNQDGKQDLVLDDPGHNGIAVLLGNGDGSFQADPYAIPSHRYSGG